MLTIGLIIFFCIIFLLIIALLLPVDPYTINLEKRFNGPTIENFFGNDHLGRCIFSRVIYGTIISLLSSISIASLSLLIGLILGLVSGMVSPSIDKIIMLICDITLSFPLIILAIVIASILEPSLKTTILGVVLYSWAWWTKFIRGMVISAREKPFVKFTKLIGFDNFYIVKKNILPQIIAPIIVSFSLFIGRIIIVVSSLSFIGLGIQPPDPELGNMLREARLYITIYPHLLLGPGFAIFLLVISFNLIGEGLREYFQVKSSYENP